MSHMIAFVAEIRMIDILDHRTEMMDIRYTVVVFVAWDIVDQMYFLDMGDQILTDSKVLAYYSPEYYIDPSVLVVAAIH